MHFHGDVASLTPEVLDTGRGGGGFEHRTSCQCVASLAFICLWWETEASCLFHIRVWTEHGAAMDLGKMDPVTSVVASPERLEVVVRRLVPQRTLLKSAWGPTG